MPILAGQLPAHFSRAFCNCEDKDKSCYAAGSKCNTPHLSASGFKSDYIVEQQTIYFWDPYPPRNCPNKKLKSPLGKISVFLKKFLDFWIFLTNFFNQNCWSKNHRWYLRLWKKFEKNLLNKFFKNQKLGSSDLDQNVVSC